MPTSKNRRKKPKKLTTSLQPKTSSVTSTPTRSSTSMPSPLTNKQHPPATMSQINHSPKTSAYPLFITRMINKTGVAKIVAKIVIARPDTLHYYYIGLFSAVLTGSVVAAGSFQLKPDLLAILVAALLNAALLGISSDTPSETANHNNTSTGRIPLKLCTLWATQMLFLTLFYHQAVSLSGSHNISQNISQNISLPNSTNQATNDAPLLLALLTLASAIIICSLPLLQANRARLVEPSPNSTALSTARLSTTTSKPAHVIALTFGFSATMYILTILAVYTQVPDTIHYAVGFLGLTPSFWGAAVIISQFENTLTYAGWKRSEQLTTPKGKKYSRPKGISLLCALFLLFLPASVFAIVALRHLPATFGAVLLLMLYTNKIMVEIFEKDFPLNCYTSKLQFAFILANCAMFVVGILSRS